MHRHRMGFEPLRAEPNGFLVHLLSHSDTVSSAEAPRWLLKHSQSTVVHQPRRLMMSEALLPIWELCIPWLLLLAS